MRRPLRMPSRQQWERHCGCLHRTDGPAIEWDNGSKAWYLDGALAYVEFVQDKSKRKFSAWYTWERTKDMGTAQNESAPTGYGPGPAEPTARTDQPARGTTGTSTG